jgi:branched-chain amino acid transport system ATP-binding protein
MGALLEVRDLHVRLGQSHILQGIEFDVPEGGVTALLGRNGVGKTTTLRALMGLVDRTGTVTYAGDDITKLATHRIVRRGVGYVPEDRDVFSALTVEENLRLAQRDGELRYELVYELFPELKERGKQPAGTLSGGQQQMVAIGRALLANPRVFLFDEPSEGLAPRLIDVVTETIAGLRELGLSAIVVEQNLHVAVGLADRVAIMTKGEIAYRATTETFRGSRATAHALLGLG